MNKSELLQLQNEFSNSLILNPTENLPWKCETDISFTEGLYIPEDRRDKDSKVCFAGRNDLRNSMTELYCNWEQALGAKASSFKLYSGLHAHIILFMSIANIGDKVLYLPEQAGGHYATKKILQRLGLEIKECAIDYENFCIDIERTKHIIDQWNPQFIFVDRSDGLVYEDFSWLNSYTDCYKIFDASQYLTHILAGDYKNPFDMGMDLILTTLHKNYPGPQKAAFFVKYQNEMWEKIENGLMSYVSNSHPLEIFKAVLSFPGKSVLKKYSKMMLENTLQLEDTLIQNGVPVVRRDPSQISTQQIWIPITDENTGFHFFKKLEQLKILTNYRMLPYNLGRGLRLGTAAATRQGLTPETAAVIANLISEAYHSEEIKLDLIKKAEKTILEIQRNTTQDYNTY